MSSDAYMSIINCMHHETVIMGLSKAHRRPQLETSSPTSLARGFGDEMALVYRLLFLDLLLQAT